MSVKAYIAAGSNLGDRAGNCTGAAIELARLDGVTVTAESSLYETEPWGDTDQGPFVNSVIEVETTLAPRELLARLKGIEAASGRTPARRWGPRVLDLDIILYGDKVIDEAGLRVPHPGMHERAFVLVPLAEIAPDAVHPVLKLKVTELLARLGKTGGVRKLERSEP